ncbi:4'-phosphopantetheinyl transferase family protein [Streptomyces purpurogeneiscleroticus]|uniref:4'-phosphopantetheinyl transferase family protein n=1 Tax=Streptomyces purpurogeneiscleroticus TaxID=68259 RepID=UPI001CC04FB7|nr:4'-phosphopantetheinyl transferase superfamily protein [Streptomyces purpurogeneiscleroticus]
MIQDVVAAQASCAETAGDPPGLTLHPAEADAVRNALPGRRAEYTTGRHCARRALAGLGVTADAISRDPKGAPRWPAGIVGSITHCEGYRAAAVVRTTHARALGIDAEPNQPLAEGVLEVVALPQEQAHLADLRTRRTDIHWDRLLFSAKESVYKSWYALTGTPLWFDDAVLDFDARNGTFTARVVRPGGPGTTLRGRWTEHNGLLATGIVIPAAGTDETADGRR